MTLNAGFAVQKLSSISDFIPQGIYFLSVTDEEISLVCEERFAVNNATECDCGWKAFRIVGVLDFSLVGILAKISAILADNGIGIFAVSTFNTDYILTKAADFDNAILALNRAGYEVLSDNYTAL